MKTNRAKKGSAKQFKAVEGRPLTEEQIAQDSKSICLRPDIFLNNGRHCEGCSYAKICLNSRKKFPAYAQAA